MYRDSITTNIILHAGLITLVLLCSISVLMLSQTSCSTIDYLSKLFVTETCHAHEFIVHAQFKIASEKVVTTTPLTTKDGQICASDNGSGPLSSSQFCFLPPWCANVRASHTHMWNRLEPPLVETVRTSANAIHCTMHCVYPSKRTR
jgi:hypothetical protein